jgi:N-acetylneuraminic acid mutarotase
MKTNNKLSAYILRGSMTALLFSCVIVAFCWAIHLPEQNLKVLPLQDNAVFGAKAHQNRSLSFADRVAYQRAIEDVYWRHRIWPNQRRDPKPALDAVMSQAQLEKKVEDYLRNSQELEDHWQRPISADQLQTEMERMANNSKQPEVLRELFEALGNNPFVIAECLARPVLAERLVNGGPATEAPPMPVVVATPLRGVARNVPPAFAELRQSRQARGYSERYGARVLVTMAAVSANYRLPIIAGPSVGCIDDTWTATTLTNAPSSRYQHTAVWTGSEMIVWGGLNGGALNTGGRYDPTTDSWTATSINNAPSARYDHTAVWTGSEMIVWGGTNNNLNTGGRYNPITDSWTATTTTNAPTGRTWHTAVWTGSEMIVWGGANGFRLNTGGRYNPSTDTWTATTNNNAPEARSLHTAVWDNLDNLMIVWGGDNNTPEVVNTGGKYDPSTDSWTATTTTNAPAPRSFPYANAQQVTVWTGSEMIVWGGFPDSFNTGGRYNPSTDSWTATSLTNAPTGRYENTAVWTGSEMIVWAGLGGGILNDGGRYDPVTNSWRATTLVNAPSVRRIHTAVWTGSEMIVWAGRDDSNTGGRYCAQYGSYPVRRRHHSRPTPTPYPR